MPLRLVEITAPGDNTSQIQEIAEKYGCIDTWHSAKNKDGRRTVKILITTDELQKLNDDIQSALGKAENWRIVVQDVEATIPRQKENDSGGKIVRGTITREELYNDIEKGAQTDFNFILLVVLSAIVCAIGLIKSNVAVIIGAMVIAPLLGPNLALAFGAALGDKALMFESVKSNAIGLGITLCMAAITGTVLNQPVIGTELMDRTEVGYDSIALALAAGAAAVLSITTGLSGALVGVMVAVALMPPAVTLGLMIGMGSWSYAYGAGLLLMANIVSISIAAQVVFLLRGIKPRTWYMRKKSKQSVKLNIAFWIVLLLMIMALIALRQNM